METESKTQEPIESVAPDPIEVPNPMATKQEYEPKKPKEGEKPKVQRKKAAPKKLAQAKTVAAPPPVASVPENPALAETKAAGGAALSLAETKRRERAEVMAGFLGEAVDKDVVYYVECEDPECMGPGIWIHGSPSGTLEPENWSSSYKPKGMAWPSTELWCQCCYERGNKTPLRMFHHAGKPVVNPRFLRDIPRKEYEQLVAEGGAQ